MSNTQTVFQFTDTAARDGLGDFIEAFKASARSPLSTDELRHYEENGLERLCTFPLLDCAMYVRLDDTGHTLVKFSGDETSIAANFATVITLLQSVPDVGFFHDITYTPEAIASSDIDTAPTVSGFKSGVTTTKTWTNVTSGQVNEYDAIATGFPTYFNWTSSDLPTGFTMTQAGHLTIADTVTVGAHTFHVVATNRGGSSSSTLISFTLV